MKVLWVLYRPIGSAGKYVGNGMMQGGGWVDATLCEVLAEKDMEIVIAAVADKAAKVVAENGVVYYGIANVASEIGKRNKKAVAIWEKLIREENPDIVQVWGTEFGGGLDVAEAAKKTGTPILFYIQGVVQAIADYPYGDVRRDEYKKYIALLNRWKFQKERRFQKQMERQAEMEKQMAQLSDGVIGDNDWFTAYFDGTDSYKHSLPVNQAFMQEKHKDELAEEYSIMCCAGRGAHKGLHLLVKALPIVKKQFPGVKVYIPGNMNARTPKWIFEPAYITYINKLIDELGVRENIVFCGQLTSQQMAERMNKSQIFVLPSCIENHSSTLREAMYLGLPCITTMVGSVHEFVQHKENGLIFRYAEAEQLAYHIKYLFFHSEERKRMGENAYESIRAQFPQEQTGVIKRIYEEVINKKKGEK